jgi:hypothetical protein
MLVRRVIVDGHTPTSEGLARLSESRARQHGVKRGDLASESELLNAVYSGVFENEFVGRDDREQILKRITEAIHVAERRTEEVDEPRELTMAVERRASETERARVLALLAITSTAVGLGFFTLVQTSEFSTSDTGVFAVALGTALLVAATATILRLRERAESEPEREGADDFSLRQRQFADEVAQALASHPDVGEVIRNPAPGLEFAITIDGRRIGIDVRAFSDSFPRSLYGTVLRLASNRGQELDEILVVVPKLSKRHVGMTEGRARLVDLGALNRYLGEETRAKAER